MGRGRFSRTIIGLEWARQLPDRPTNIPKSRPRGTKADGLRYERALAKALLVHGFQHGLWFEFKDLNGYGYCSPDLIRVDRDCVIVIEAKLTDGLAARHQLKNLYIPVLGMVFQKPVAPVVALRHVTYEVTSELHDSITEALATVCTRQWPPSVLHWLGRGQVL